MTNNKTVTMSRELAQKVDDLMYIMTGHDSYPRLIHKYGKEWWTPVNEMRAEICTLLATPVVESQEPVGYGAWNTGTNPGTRLIRHDGLVAVSPTPSDFYCIPVYTSPSAPVAVDAVKAFAKGFNTLETIDGKYKIVMQFAGHEDAWAAYTSLSQMTACLDKVKELNQ